MCLPARARPTKPWLNSSAPSLSGLIFPKHTLCLGFVFHSQGKLDQAAARYERALALKPDLVQAQNNLGNIFREQGKLDQAAARFEQAIALRPDLPEMHNNLGNVLRDQGKLDQAVVPVPAGARSPA